MNDAAQRRSLRDRQMKQLGEDVMAGVSFHRHTLFGSGENYEVERPSHLFSPLPWLE
jgi:hypothetical protein